MHSLTQDSKEQPRKSLVKRQHVSAVLSSSLPLITMRYTLNLHILLQNSRFFLLVCVFEDSGAPEPHLIAAKISVPIYVDSRKMAREINEIKVRAVPNFCRGGKSIPQAIVSQLNPLTQFISRECTKVIKLWRFQLVIRFKDCMITLQLRIFVTKYAIPCSWR